MIHGLCILEACRQHCCALWNHKHAWTQLKLLIRDFNCKWLDHHRNMWILFENDLLTRVPICKKQKLIRTDKKTSGYSFHKRSLVLKRQIEFWTPPSAYIKFTEHDKRPKCKPFRHCYHSTHQPRHVKYQYCAPDFITASHFCLQTDLTLGYFLPKSSNNTF